MSDVATLVHAAAGGDRAAWDQLVSRYNALVWSVARAHRLSDHDASDVVQTAWLRAVEHLERIQNPDSLGAWLATTARHESLRAIRLGSRQLPSGTDFRLEEADDARVETRLLEGERDHALWRAVGRLSERCQALLRLLVAEPPPSYEEVSAALDMPIGSIGPTRARCLERLREHAQTAGLIDDSGSRHE